MNHATQSTETPSSNNRGVYLAAALLAVLGIVVAVNRWGGPAEVEVRTTGEIASTVMVDPAEGVTFSAEIESRTLPGVTVAHQPGMTVLDGMRKVAESNSDWQFSYEGEQLVLLTRLAETNNEGVGGRNWLYELNGELAQLGIRSQTVERGDRILWKFAPHE